MAKIKLQGNASGTGVLTVTAPNTNTDRTITLPDADVTLGTDATKLPLAGGTLTGDLDISDTGAGALTVGGTTNAYSAPVLFTVSDIGLDVTDGTKHLASWASHAGSSHAGSAIGTRSNHDLALITNDTKRVVINTAGVVSIPQGIELGSGIDATAANTLDDYEEGTWTPNLNINNNTTGIAYSERTGLYTKIGRMVYCSCRITLSDKGSLSGDLSVQGLPFSLANLGGCYGVAAMGFGTNFYGSTFGQHNHIFTADPNGTTVHMRYIQDNGNWNGLTNSMIQNDSDWVLGFTYQSA